MYELLFGKHPKTALTMEQLISNHKTKNIDFGLNNYSSHCIDLVKRLLKNDPLKRIDWFEFFSHKWFDFCRNELNIEKQKTVVIKFRTVANKPSNCDLENNMILESSNPIQIKKIDLHQHHYSTNPNPKITSKLGSPTTKSPSPLGYSNLSKMKFDDNILGSSPTSYTYSNYPSSYPPNKKSSNTDITISNSFSNSFSNSINLSTINNSFRSKSNNIISNDSKKYETKLLRNISKSKLNISKTTDNNSHYFEAKSKSATSINNSLVTYVDQY